MDPRGAVALITGGASGLGLATARTLAARGANVVIVDRPTSEGAAVAKASEAITFAPADVLDPDAVARAVSTAADLGPLRIVVNCAGIGDPARTVARGVPLDLDRFRRVIEVNLIGTFNVVRLAVATMTTQTPILTGERGVVVNTASVAAFDGQVGQASYSASKGGIAAMTLPLAREFASAAIRVMTIAPGTFDTPILSGLSDEIRASLAAQVPHPHRMGDPAEYGALVEHIVDNPMLNGEVIRLDGAIRMAPQ